jgi:hypothetical protein
VSLPHCTARDAADRTPVETMSTCLSTRNDPEVTYAESKACCPINVCALDVVDHVEVLYYDSPVFDKVNNQTRCCNELLSWCCGGQGQRVQIKNTLCCDLCIVGKNGALCCPVCCPDALVRPCTMQYNIWVEDAESTVYEMKQAKLNAKARMGLA